MELNPVYEPRLLNPSKVYQIDGGLYQYLRQSGTSTNPRYVFGHLPTPGHKKKSDIVLNRTKLAIRCQEVVGMSVSISAPEDNSEQLQLF
jgi:predicted sulfurtransferase